MKVNGGTLVIDDFGRQRVDPRDLLNRGIIPLESRVDYLNTLHTGKKIEVPFELLLIRDQLEPGRPGRRRLAPAAHRLPPADRAPHGGDLRADLPAMRGQAMRKEAPGARLRSRARGGAARLVWPARSRGR